MKLSSALLPGMLAGLVVWACGGSSTGSDSDDSAGRAGSENGSGGVDNGSGGKNGNTGGSGLGGAAQGGSAGSGSEDCVVADQVVYYRAEGNAKDEVSGDAGSLEGSVTATASGKFGKAFGFDSNPGYVLTPASAGGDFGTGDFSIAFWIKTANGGYILDKRSNLDTSPIGYHVLVYSGHITLQIADALGYDNYQGDPVTTAVNDDEWHHVVLSVDRDQSDGLKFFIDGELADEQNPTAHMGSVTNTATMVLGGHLQQLDSGNVMFTGMLDEVQMYSRALTGDEAELLASQATLGCD